MRSVFRLNLLAVLLLAFIPSLVLAQKQKNEDANTRTVQGTVTESGGNSVAGAIVQLKNTKTLQIRSFITKEQGTYYFNALNPDVDYELRAMFGGAVSPTKTLSSFDGRKQAIMNLKLEK